MTIAVLEGREDSAIFDFRCWPKPDIKAALANVRFWGDEQTWRGRRPSQFDTKPAGSAQVTMVKSMPRRFCATQILRSANSAI